MRVAPRPGTDSLFAEARTTAAANGMPGYLDWRAALERQYTVMPLWYWDTAICRRNYAAYIHDCLDWQRQQAQINHENRAFHRRITPSSDRRE